MFTGLYTAIITPFRKNGDFDEAAFSRIIEQQISGGVDGIVVLGTTGESPTVTPEEHDMITKLAVNLVNKRVKVIAGAGSNSTQEAIDRSLHAQNVGVDGLLQVNPYYNKPSQEGLYQHFQAIAQSVEIPIILYNIAGRTGVNLETETLLRLVDHPNIVSVKEASGDMKQIKEVINSVPEDFTVLSGDDGLTLDLMKSGGHGVISVLSNVLPTQMQELVTAAREKDWDKAEKSHQNLSDLFNHCFIETNPQPIKTLMAHEGLCEEVFRLPMVNMEEGNKAIVLQDLEDLKR